MFGTVCSLSSWGRRLGRRKGHPGAQARRGQRGAGRAGGAAPEESASGRCGALLRPPGTERAARALPHRRQPPVALAPRSRAQRGAAPGCRDHPGPHSRQGPGELLRGLAGTGRRGDPVAGRACPLVGWTPCLHRAVPPRLSSGGTGRECGVSPHPGPAALCHRPVTRAPLLPLWREGGGPCSVG